MTRRVFYKKDAERYDSFLGIKLTESTSRALEREAARAGRLKADFVRHVIDLGLASWLASSPQPRSDRARPDHTAGFMLAPILYMLALAGVGGAVMFSGYSQVLRSNAEMTAINTVRQQLQAAGQTLSATSVLDTATSSIVEPPAVAALAGVSDPNRFPALDAIPVRRGVAQITHGTFPSIVVHAPARPRRLEQNTRRADRSA